jgi:branched-chain amino acid transport system permease protein
VGLSAPEPMGVDFANVVVNGITNGCIYALIGVGFVVIFRATGVVSFAQGTFMMVGALLFGSCIRAGIGMVGALAIIGAVLLIIGGAVYWLVFARLVGAEAFIVSVATIGLGTLLEAVGLLIWGPGIINIPLLFSYRTHHIVGALAVNGEEIFTFVFTVALFALIVFGMQKTPLGLRMRAVANNPRLAALAGVNVVRMSLLSWAIAAATGGFAGVVYLLGTQPDPGTVYSLGLAAFPAILLGGLDSVPGALVGGILIGLLEASIATWVGGDWQDVVSYLVLLVVMLFRPQGLFGSSQISRL